MYYINLDENSLLRIFPHLFHNQTSEKIAQEYDLNIVVNIVPFNKGI